MRSDFPGPLNLGQDRLVSVNQLVDVIAAVAGVKVVKSPADMGVKMKEALGR